jgi:hypothetical protein
MVVVVGAGADCTVVVLRVFAGGARMSDIQVPALRLFCVTLVDRVNYKNPPIVTHVFAHTVDLFEGALRFHDWIPLPEELQDNTSKFQQMNRRGFAAGTWLEYEEVTGQQSKSVN